MPVPASWSPNIVVLKTYSASGEEGAAIWRSVQDRLERHVAPRVAEIAERYGKPVLIRLRLGRIMVTDAYRRRCAISGERTLPALEAAHIRPYAEGGSHEPTNGLLLRRDIHALFDDGYVTVTPDLRFEVSRRIKEEFENGRHYYALHGQRVEEPLNNDWRPDSTALAWHNETRFR
jgi:putative restriction endonuclease